MPNTSCTRQLSLRGKPITLTINSTPLEMLKHELMVKTTNEVIKNAEYAISET